METIKASPTKEFFINMLTRDVVLDRAILDLIDNSVDAAHKLGDLSTKRIEVDISNDQFSIKDNCGGIDKDTAKEYAFRLGRSKDSPESPSSVGQFGVGMKRALFKMGKSFEVRSLTNEESFVVDVDVDTWLEEADEWEFKLQDIERNDPTVGTYITVNDLYEGVSEQFGLETFVRSVIDDIGKAHFRALGEGLSISVNQQEVSSSSIEIIKTDQLSPIGKEIVVDDVSVKIIAGVSTRELHNAGWYVVCNGRLIAEADTSSVTGWNVDGVRRYHPDFAYFKGLVELESEDASKLPWTTTKTGIDVDNSIYRRVLSEMKPVMREVMSFLSERAKEDKDFRDEKITERPLNDAIEEGGFCDTYDIEEFSTSFQRPDSTKSINPDPLTTIQYKMPASKVDLVKSSLGVSSNRELGVETFQYYLVDGE